MTALFWQTALLLLGAYFLGAWIACFVRRAVFVRQRVYQPAFEPMQEAASREQPSPTIAAPPLAERTTAPGQAEAPRDDRFVRALVGEPEAEELSTREQDVLNRVRALKAVARAAEDVSVPPQAEPPAASQPPPAPPATVTRPDLQPAPAAIVTPKVVEPPQPAPRMVLPIASGTTGQASVAANIADDLECIQGIDPQTHQRLASTGISTFAEIAEWTASDVADVEALLGQEGQVARENWIEQAKMLAAGTPTQYSEQRARRLAEPKAQTSETAPLPTAVGYKDDLTRISGINREVQRVLQSQGISRFSQIAALAPEEIARLEQLLGVTNRMAREHWIEQAQALASPTGLPASPYLQPVSPPDGRKDDLKQIRGIGVLIEQKLNQLGIWRHEQIAGWTAADISRISAGLDFKDRIEREDWIGQARILASGGSTEFARRMNR